MDDPTAPTRARDTRRRDRTIVLVAILGIVALAGGYLVATASDDGDVATVPTTGPTTSPTAPSATSATPAPPSAATPSATPTTDADILDDGLHFVQVAGYEANRDGSPALRFDLAYLYTGADAQAYAQAHDIELTNDYVIVNDNPRLRWMPLADDVKIEYIPEGTCCETQPGTLDGFEAAVNGIAMTDYPDMDTTWWFLTVADGHITQIVEQYFP